MGASVVFVQGCRRRDAPDSIGRLSDGVGGRIFANVCAAGFVGALSAVKVISGGTEGLLADARISYPLAVSSRFTQPDHRSRDAPVGLVALTSRMRCSGPDVVSRTRLI